MEIQPTYGIVFNSHLKELYKKGKLKIDRGFYGEKLTKKNVSDEHLICRCFGGTNDESNIVLTSKEANNLRGNKPIEQFLTYGMIRDYLKNFVDVKVDGFDGNKYIEGIKKTLEELLSD